MGQPKLRIYFGPEETSTAFQAKDQAPPTVTVPLGEVFPLLADAVESERTWIRDFEDEEITIPADLYEVILAYQHYRRPSA